MDSCPELRTLLHTPDRTHQLWAHTISMSAAQMHRPSPQFRSTAERECVRRCVVAPQLDQICADFSQSQRIDSTSAHNQQPSDTRGGSDSSWAPHILRA